MQLLPDPPAPLSAASSEGCVAGGDQGGAIAQLGERLVCNQKVAGSIPAGSTIAPAARLPNASRLPRDDAR